jgi:DNA-binding NtrC family response regulator
MPLENTSPRQLGRRHISPGPLPSSLRDLIKQAAETSIPVLLEGETGTGKTYLAEWIHRMGPRSGKPFVPVNCATLPPSLIEAELFGTIRGAFTDAKESRAGLAETAAGGTLFLDEIAELPQAEQSKLLTLVEDGWIRRVGCTHRIAVDVRIICATSRNLAELIANRGFREDLYYRCCGLRIRIPPLRHRREQVPAIVRHLLPEIRERQGFYGGDPSMQIEPEALDVLCAHPWPGNIRQLAHALTLAVLNARGAPIRPEHIQEDLLLLPTTPPGGGRGPGREAKRYVAPADPSEERRSIIAALQQTRGNKTRAAHALGMSRQVLWERIRTHRITDAEWAAPS